jgi:hypothetical protein
MVNSIKAGLIQFFVTVAMLVVALSFAIDANAQYVDWPRDVQIDSGVLTVYQPQVDEMEKDILHFRAAVAYKASDSEEPVFGAAWFESRLEIDRESRMVRLLTLKVKDTRFPEGSEHVKAEFEQALKIGLPTWNLDFSLDDLLTSLEAAEEQIETARDLKMDPPEIIYRSQPALLIMIDGEPVLREIENSPYKAVINTPYPLIVDTAKNSFYLNAAKAVWYRAGAATGPYEYLANVPSEIAGMVDQSEMEDSDEVVTADNAPEIIVQTKPAELLVTEGEATFDPLVDDLLVINNSASDVFMHVSSQNYYIVLSGRWYKSAAMQGPWVFVNSDSLPPAFQQIPEDSNQADSRVYVAGTDEAREAVMDAQIPQTAAVAKGRVEIDVNYDGEPSFVAIKGTDLVYAENSDSTVIRSEGRYYLVEDAVWYVSTTPSGPWEVSESRPDDVESIPPESPVYNVKYVYIYETTPEVVYVGYTPGYTGSYVYHTTIVYGTGWYYRPWVSPYYYYPYHATWGFHVTYNPWTGWGFGLSWGWGPFRIGFHTGGYWHRHHRWHHRHWGGWGPGGYRPRPVHFGDNNININVDRNRDRDGLRTRDNNLYRDRDQAAKVRETRDTPMNRDTRERVSSREAGADRSKVSNRVSASGSGGTRDRASNQASAAKKNNVFTDKQGNVYRNTDNGWQKRDGGSWKDSAASSASRPATSTNNTRPSTTTSNQRQAYQSSTRQSQAYKSSNSGYNRSSSLDRQNYSRQRSSSRNTQHSRQMSSRPSRGRRR